MREEIQLKDGWKRTWVRKKGGGGGKTRGGEETFQKKVKKLRTGGVQPLQPEKKTDIIGATSVFSAALPQSRAGALEEDVPRA